MRIDRKNWRQWSSFVKFAVTLFVIVGFAFLALFALEQELQQNQLVQRAHEISWEILAVRDLFAEKQDEINKDTNGNIQTG